MDLRREVGKHEWSAATRWHRMRSGRPVYTARQTWTLFWLGMLLGAAAMATGVAIGVGMVRRW